jgi:hypothetical protein
MNSRSLVTGWRCGALLGLFWAAAVCSWSAIGAGSFSLPLFLGALLLALPILGLGQIVACRLLPGLPLAADGLFVFLCGFFSLNVLLFVLAFVCPFGPLFNLFLVFAATSFVFLTRQDLRGSVHRMAIADSHALLALLVASVAPVLWFQEGVGFSSIRSDGVVFHAWADVFIHGSFVNMFSRVSGLGHLHNVFMAGAPLPLYHYAAYIVPATLKALSGAPGILLASTVMPCLGLFLVALSAYGVGRIYFRGPGGIAATCAAVLLPDPSFYGVASRWNSYYFFLETSVALGYAVALMGLALALIMGGLTSDDRRPMWVGLVAAAFVVWFKAPVAVAYAFVTCALGLAFLPHSSSRQRAVLSAGALVGLILSVAILRRLPGVPTLGWATTGPPATVVAMLGLALPTGLIGMLFSGPFQAAQSSVGRLSIGAAVALLGYFGVFALLSPLGVRQALRLRLPRPIIAYQGLVILNLLVVALLLAPNASGRGDPYEIIHKTFAWPYFVTVTWLGAILGGTLVARLERATAGKALTALLVALACAVPVAFGDRTLSGIGWAGHSGILMPQGLHESAMFLKDKSSADAIVQMQPPNLDAWMMLPAVSERVAFVATYGGPRQRQAEERRRRDLMTGVLQTADAVSARRALDDAGIDWLVTETGQSPPWLQRLTPDFASGSYRVYRVSALSE